MKYHNKFIFTTKLIYNSVLFLIIFTIFNLRASNAQIKFFASNCYPNQKCNMNLLANQQKLSVTGNIIYRERIALPKGSIINIKLVDISRQDTSSITITEQEIVTNRQQVPIPFKLEYDTKDIKPNHTYAVQARITIQDKLAFISTKVYPVITKGNPNKVEVLVQKISSNSSKSQSYIGEWLLEDLGGMGVIDNLQTTMQLTEDGKIYGNAGCNRYTGSYTIKDNQLKISPLATTFKMCSPAIMDQEMKFLKALSSTTKINYDGNFLFIESDNLENPLRFTLLK